MADIVTYQQISLAALKWGKYPTSENNVHSLVTWAVSENSLRSTRFKALWNPWDTTEPMPGAFNFNSAGVKNYPSIEVGLDAFIKTLTNGYYEPIIHNLLVSAPPAITCASICASPWGSQPTSELLLQVMKDWNYYATLDIHAEILTPAQVASLNDVNELFDKQNELTKVLEAAVELADAAMTPTNAKELKFRITQATDLIDGIIKLGDPHV